MDKLVTSEEERREELLGLTLNWPGCRKDLEKSSLLLGEEGVATLQGLSDRPLSGTLMMDTHLCYWWMQ